MVVEPGLIDFGMADPTLNTWTDTLQIIIKNIRTTSQQISLQDIEGLPAGAGLTFSGTSFLLAPQQDTSITAILTVPKSVPLVQTQPGAYTGSIECVSDSDNINIPFAFFKATSIVITCDVAPNFFSISNRETGYFSTNFTPGPGITRFIAFLPEGTYDIVAQMEKDTLGFQNTYFISHPIVDTTGVTYVNISYHEATINMASDSIYDMNNNRIYPNSNSSWYSQADLISDNENGEKFEIFGVFPAVPSGDNLYLSPLDTGWFVQKDMVIPAGTTLYALTMHKHGIASRQDVTFHTGSNGLAGFGLQCGYDNPLFDNSNYSKEIQVNFNMWKSLFGLELGQSQGYNIPYFPNGTIYFNKEDGDISTLNQYTSTGLCVGYSNDQATDSTFTTVLTTPEIIQNDSGQVQLVQKMVDASTQPVEQSTALNIAQLNPGDTFSLVNNSWINFPDYITGLKGDTLAMITNDLVSSQAYEPNDGGTKESNGIYVKNNVFAPTWYTPLFGEQVFSHNKIQNNISVGGSTSKIGAYYIFKNLKENGGVYEILANPSPYTLLGQSGQCTADFKYQLPSLSNWPENAPVYFPAVSLFQVLANGTPAQWVQTGQAGKIRLILYDPNNNVDSVGILLLPPSGQSISLSVTKVSTQLVIPFEYDAALPANLTAGFFDAVVLVKDANGNKFEMTAAPAFYYGSTMNNVRFDSRIRMSSFRLNNAATVNFNTGDTLNYTLSYFNYGNNTARNIKVTFPSSPYFTPVGSQSFILDSLNANDTAYVPLKLVSNGNQQSSIEQTDYTPLISWTSGATTYQRENYLFIDFPNVDTGLARNGNGIPDKFELYQNYPNPFNPSTTIRCDISNISHVTLYVYNVLGQMVAKLVDGLQMSGSYRVTWDGTAHGHVASGVYFLQIRAGDYVKTVKMLLLK